MSFLTGTPPQRSKTVCFTPFDADFFSCLSNVATFSKAWQEARCSASAKSRPSSHHYNASVTIIGCSISTSRRPLNFRNALTTIARSRRYRRRNTHSVSSRTVLAMEMDSPRQTQPRLATGWPNVSQQAGVPAPCWIVLSFPFWYVFSKKLVRHAQTVPAGQQRLVPFLNAHLTMLFPLHT